MTGEELLSTTYPPRRWAIKDLVPRGGVTILAGKQKEGKSWFAFDMALCVVEGRPFLGRFEVEQGRAIYGALEDDPTRMQERLTRLLEAHHPQDPKSEPQEPTVPPGLEILTADELPPAAEGGWAELIERIEDTPDLRLVTIDVMECFDPIKGGYHVAGAGIRKLGKIAREYDVAIVAVLHMYRGGMITAASPDWMDKVQGGIGGPSAAAAVLGLGRPRDGKEGVLRASGKDVPELALALKWEGGVFSIEGELPMLGEQLSRKQALISEMVSEHGWGIDPVSGAKETIPLGVSASDCATLVREKTQDPSYTYNNVRQMMHQMAKADPPLLVNIERRYYTPFQAGLLRRSESGNEQTSFGEAITTHGREFVA